MTRTVWEYYVPIIDDFTLDIPFGSKFLNLELKFVNQKEQQQQYHNIPILWVLVEPKMEKIRHKFKWFRTGESIPGSDYLVNNVYIGTVQSDIRVPFHLFWTGLDESSIQQQQQEATTTSISSSIPSVSTREKQKGVPSTSD